MDRRVGTVLEERYRILAPIAEGGMGSVYRGERLQLGRPVAIKFLHEWVAKDPSMRRRFEVEARAMSRLSQPNCVSVIDFGVADAPYIVMDLVTGETLRAALHAGPLPAARALRIARQLMAGLAHAHAQGIIHRDIKPENIVLEQGPAMEDHVRLLDFGLAKLLNSQTVLTVGVALGTPNYMAPEQLGEGTVDERTDIYASGIVLFEMLTGQKPFDSADVGQVFRRHLMMPPPKLRSVSPKANHSAELEALVLRAMAKAQAERFATAMAMAAALDAVPEARGASSAPAPAAGDRTVIDETVYAGSATPPPSEAPLTLVEPRKGTSPSEHRVTWSGVLDRLHVLTARALALPRARGSLARLGRMRGWAFDVRGRVLARIGSGSRRRRVFAGVSLVAALVAAIGVASLDRGGSQPLPPASAAAVLADPPPPVAARESQDLGEVSRLVARGDRDGALRLLASLGRQEPRDTRIAALRARLYFEKLWWSEGIAAFRAAVLSDPKLAGDPVLVSHVIRSLQSSQFHERGAAFVRELGEAARPQVEEAARSHAIPSVRSRAALLLRSWPRS